MLKNSCSRLPAYFAGGVSVFLIVSTVLTSYETLPAYQWTFVFGVTALSAGLYLFLDKGVLKHQWAALSAVAALYALAATAVFYPTSGDVFRSDYWLIAFLFIDSWKDFSMEALKNISLFEMFGNIRFQPFAHLLMFIRHLAFGNEVFLYHLLNIALHISVSFSVFLVLRKLTGDIRFSFIFGLLFIVLPSQFDTVVWTYHIYIVMGALFVLLAFLLSLKSAETGKLKHLWLGVTLAIFSAFLYEPAIFAPFSLFFVFLAGCQPGGEPPSWKKLLYAAGMIASAYLLYIGVTAYGLTLTKEKQNMSLSSLLTQQNIAASMKAVFVNLWESTILKNLSVSKTEVKELVYVSLPDRVFSSPSSALKLAAGLFLWSMCRVTKKHVFIITILLSVAFTYLFIISLGRMFTNDISYIMSQPRYQYFFNAIIITVAGLLLWPKYTGQGLRPAIIISLIAIFFLDAQTVMDSNNKVAMAMSPVDTYYYSIKDFIKNHPSSRIFLSSKPVQSQLNLGVDTSLEVLFDKNITYSLNAADYIYDGKAFTKNPRHQKGGGNPYLGDFTVSLDYHHHPSFVPRKNVEIIGSGKIYPRVSLTRFNSIEVEMINETTGQRDFYTLEYPYSDSFDTSLAIEKDGDELCVIHNNKLLDKVKLNSVYKNWDGDGIGLLGRYYRGLGEPVWVTGLSVQMDGAFFNCRNHQKGEVLKRLPGA